jgi:hypothetical protein
MTTHDDDEDYEALLAQQEPTAMQRALLADTLERVRSKRSPEDLNALAHTVYEARRSRRIDAARRRDPPQDHGEMGFTAEMASTIYA